MPGDLTTDLALFLQDLTAGILGRFKTFTVVKTQPVLFAALPTPSEGMTATITDGSTAVWAATVTGGGANRVQIRYNGSAWTVMGA